MKIFGIGVPELIILCLPVIVIIVIVVIIVAVASGNSKKKSQTLPNGNQNAQPAVTAEQLAEYKKLLDEGIITQQDFDEKKQLYMQK